jgi:transposase
VRAVYEAGPTGFGLARAGRERGIDVRVAAPGSIPKGSGDRVKTDRRDVTRLVRLPAAGEPSFAFVPAVADECFRDLVRCIDPARPRQMFARRVCWYDLALETRQEIGRAHGAMSDEWCAAAARAFEN